MTWVAAEKARRGMAREALADVLMDRATWTHDRLCVGRSQNVELHEETITQDLVLDTATVLSAMTVEIFTRQKESRNGADWQWEWGFYGQRWFGLRVQAKRLKEVRPGQLGYDLGYQVGKKRTLQVELLIDEARADGVEAAYALYNGPDLDISRFPWGCRRLPPSPAFFGVSILPATVARDLVKAGTVDVATVGAYARPWSCLVTCDPSIGCGRFRSLIRRPSGTDADDLAWWAARSYFRIVAQDRSGLDQESTRYQDVLGGLREEPPPYVDSLFNESAPDEVLPPKVGALTVIHDPAVIGASL